MLSFTQLQELLKAATSPSAGSAFYRHFYTLLPGEGALNVPTPEAWQALRPLTKDDLIASPLSERSFLPLGSLDHLRTSSGTSGKPPLFSPRTHVRAMDYRLSYHDFKGAFMAYTVPMMPHWHERFMEEYGFSPRVITYDPRFPRGSARLARIAGVEGVSLFVYHVQAAGEALKEEGIAERIRFFEITGEVCTRALYEYLRSSFPNAVIVQSYNSSEVEDAHMGIPCKAMNGTEPLAVYHGKDTHYLELIDPETGAPVAAKKGAEGDLLVTAYPGEPSSFPLIRFRIGDTVRVIEERCPHGTWSFTVLGRTDMDFLKVSGGVLRADEVARVLRLFPERVTDRFSLRCAETPTERGPLLSAILSVETIGDTDLEALAHEVAERLRVNPELTWTQGVAQGRFLPLRCEILTNAGSTKQRRIVVH
jgi:hypothetical protein